MKRPVVVLIALAVLALAGVYLHGSFDRLLSGVGLNYHECARNGFGATFCGTELDQYRRRVQGVKETAKRVSETGQRETEEHQASEHHEEEHTLEAKMSQERKLVETEPQGSYPYDLAKAEYESARSQLQQLRIGG